jgi:hypothetical protein
VGKIWCQLLSQFVLWFSKGTIKTAELHHVLTKTLHCMHTPDIAQKVGSLKFRVLGYRCSSVVEHLPYMVKTLCSIRKTAKTTKKSDSSNFVFDRED